MNLTLSTRIFVGFAAVVLTFGAVSVYSVLQMHAIGAEIRLVSTGYLPLAKAIAQVESAQGNHQRDLQRLLDEREPETQLALIRLSRLSFPQMIRQLLGNAAETARHGKESAPASEHPFISELGNRILELSLLYESYGASCESLFRAIEKSGTVERGAQGVLELTQLENRIESEIKVLSLMLDHRVSQRVAAAEKSEGRAAWVVVALSLAAVALGALATALAVRLLAPIRPLTRAVTRVGMGDYSAVVPSSAKSEIGLLGREFNAMAKALREREALLAEKQEALVRAERLAAIGRISAQIAHEIRNPLTSLGLNSELLDDTLRAARFDRAEEREEAHQLHAAIVRELERLTEITDQYLKFARFPKPVLASHDPNALLTDLLDFLDEEHLRAGIKIERALAPGCPRLICDADQLRQALMNLLRNSREALVHGGTIRVESRPLVTQIELAVSDDGPGIPPEELSRLFDPFFSTKERGTGLGLALTQQIVTEMGGALHPESRPGEGTRFVIHLRRAS